MPTTLETVMTQKPVTIGLKSSLLEATRLLKQKGFKHLPVVDGRGKLVGVVTDRDLKRASASDATTLEVHELLYLMDQVTIEQVMTPNPKTATPGDDVRHAARMMMEGKIGCLPIVEGEGVVGIVTRDDLLGLLAHSGI